MMKSKANILLLVWVICIFSAFSVLAPPAFGRDGVYTPKRGTAERKAIMDSLRVPVQEELRQKVIFVVDRLKVFEDWAFLFGTPRKSNGQPINYRNTPHWEDYKAGIFDDNISALLRRKRGQWQVVTYDIGATDVVWETWPQDFGAPGILFKY